MQSYTKFGRLENRNGIIASLVVKLNKHNSFPVSLTRPTNFYIIYT